MSPIWYVYKIYMSTLFLTLLSFLFVYSILVACSKLSLISGGTSWPFVIEWWSTLFESAPYGLCMDLSLTLSCSMVAPGRRLHFTMARMGRQFIQPIQLSNGIRRHRVPLWANVQFNSTHSSPTYTNTSLIIDLICIYHSSSTKHKYTEKKISNGYY